MISSNSIGAPIILNTSLTHIMSSGPTPSPGTRVTFILWSRTGSGDEIELLCTTVIAGGTHNVFEGVCQNVNIVGVIFNCKSVEI